MAITPVLNDFQLILLIKNFILHFNIKTNNYYRQPDFLLLFN
jgi:hypothetical protein